MGYECDNIALPCGCIKHYEYEEYCGMGPVDGTQRNWTEYCTIHGGRLPTKVQQNSTIQSSATRIQEIKMQQEKLSQEMAELQQKMNLELKKQCS